MRTSLRRLGLPSKLCALLAALAAVLSFQGCGGGGADCGGPFCVTPPEATRVRVGSGDGQTGAPGRKLAQPLDVVVTDNDNRPVADVKVSFSVSSGGGAVSQSSSQSDIQGHAQVSWTLGPDPGAQSVQATANGKSGSPLAGAPVTFSAQAVRPPPARIVLRSGPPDAAQNGVPFTQQPVVVVLDADDQPLPQVAVIASIASGGGSLSGTNSVASDTAGRASYTDLAILGRTGPRTLRFSVTDPALQVASGTIQLTAGTPSEIAGMPPLTYEGTVNSPVSPAPAVVVKDAAGNPVPGVVVTFTPDRDASVAPPTVTTNAQGVAQVTSWTLGTSSNGQYSLTAHLESSALAPVLFSAIAHAGAAGRLQIVTQPSSPAQNGAPITVQPVIQVTDQNGNPIAQANVVVTATVSAGSGTVGNASATTNASGQATFSGLTITGAVGTCTIAFSALDLAGVTSNPISLAAGPAAKLALASAPPATRSRVPLAPQPSIQVQDASGNAVAVAGIQVGTAITSGEGTLGGQATATTDANGLATFTDLVITGVPGPRTLSFTSTSPALNPITVPVTLPSVASLAVQAPPPSPLIVGATVSNAPAWVLKDATSLAVADVPVVLSPSPGGSVVPTSGTSDPNGIIQVQSWTLATVAGDQYVVVAVTGTQLSDTIHVNAMPGAADSLQKIKGDSQTATIKPTNSNLDSLLVVRVVDRFGNGVGGVTVQWRACDGTGGFDDATEGAGYSSALQPTGAAAGTFCTRASSSGLKGSPVEFTYFVTAAATSPSQLRTERSVLKPGGPPPVAPPRPVRRPYSR